MATDVVQQAADEIAAIESKAAVRHILHGRWHGAALILGLAAVAAAVVIQPAARPTPEVLAGLAMEALEAGRREDVLRFSQEILRHDRAGLRLRAIALFAVGSLYFQQADQANAQDRPGQYWRAAQLLQQADQWGLPVEHRAELVYRLGVSLLGSDAPESAIARLQQAAELLPERRFHCLRLQVQAFQRLARPDYAAAAHAMALVLQDPSASADQRREDTLTYGRLLVEAGEHGRALEVLGAIEPQTAEGRQGRFWRAVALAAQGQHAQANELFVQVANDLYTDGALRRQAAFRQAECLVAIGQQAAALEAWRDLRRRYPNTDESFACLVREADALSRRGQPVEALDVLEQAVGQIRDPERFANPYTSISEIKDLLGRLWRELLKQGDYGRAVAAAQRLLTVDTTGLGRLLEAQATEAWARAEEADLDRHRPAEQAGRRAAAAAHYVQAGDAYAQVARQRQTTREYMDYIWASAQAYRRGGHDAQALDQLQEFLRVAETDARYPQALVDMGRCLRRLGRFDEAIRCYTQAIQDFPKNQATFAARLERALCYQDQGEDDRAEELLRHILNDGDLTPEAQEWRESLLAAGRLAFRRKQYALAVRRLEEAIERYPQGEESRRARYLLARSYHRWAQPPSDQELQALAPRARLRVYQDCRQRWTKALDLYRDLVDRLQTLERDNRLTPAGEQELSNSLFAIGDCLAAMDRFAEAIAAYEQAATHHQGTVWAVAAYTQIAYCHRRMNDEEQARRTLEKARWLLRQLPEAAFDKDVVPLDRRQWEKWIELGVAGGRPALPEGTP